jgi:cell migration-inducing and hyaluronan-binding protein
MSNIRLAVVFWAHFFTCVALAAPIVGNIDGLRQDSNGFTLVGWACDQSVSSSIYVHLYAGATAGNGGTFVTYLKADVAAEPGVNTACKTQAGTPHRFRIPLTSSMISKYANQPLYVHGISLSQQSNLAINQSGKFMMPAPAVIGKIESAVDMGTFFRVAGWACQYNVLDSLSVHLYSGGPADGGGTFINSASANLPSTAAVGAQCGTGGLAYGFNIDVTREQYEAHVGEAIYVHGIHKVGSYPNSAVSGSGDFHFPAVATYKLSEKLLDSASGADFSVPESEKIVIDQSADLGVINVQGQMVCQAAGDYTLKTQGILVEGENALFECGNNTQKFLGDLTISLKSGRQLTSMMMPDHVMGERAFAAMHGGTIRLFGDGKKVGWQRIAAAVAAGSNTVSLSVASPNWQVGDRIVIGPTSYNYLEAEERLVTAVNSDGTIITVDKPFLYYHSALRQAYSNGRDTWTLDERAEVANLTRNIKIISDGTDADLDAAQFGGHMMIMASAFGYIDGVEFSRLGQMGVLGRYPFHWHLAGHVPGQFIRNSSIRNSYQRCLSVHGTHDAVVQNNVCYNHFGHGFFLENGSETNNSIIGNLSMLSKRIPQAKALLISDFQTSDHTRFSAASGFWISNPNNIVRDNVASGAQGTGFWMAFSQSIVCNAANSCEVGGVYSDGVTVRPAYTPTLDFSNNVAHSADVGMTWDGAPDGALTNNPLNSADRAIVYSRYYYDSLEKSGAVAPVFENVEIFKNRSTGIYYRGATSEFHNLIAADNPDSLFFAYNQVVRDSLLVGLSTNTTTADLEYLRNLGITAPIHGVRLYDGPFDLRNVHFADFSASPVVQGTWNATAVPFFALGGYNRFLNSVQGVTFSPQPLHKFDFDNLNVAKAGQWQDMQLTSAIRDLDGSLTGVAGSLVRPNHSLNDNGTCEKIPNENALRCMYKMSVLEMGESGAELGNSNTLNFRVDRSDGQSMSWDGIRWFNKINMILGNDYSYRVTFLGSQFPQALRVSFQTESAAMSPVIEFVGLKNGCMFAPTILQLSSTGVGAMIAPQQVSSLAELTSMTSQSSPASYFRDPTGRLYMRFFSKERDALFTSTNAAAATTHRLDFKCL